MVGPDRPNQGHDHKGRQIRDADIQSGTTFTGVAESEPAANERTATAALSARDAAAAATLHKAGTDSIPPACLPAGQANSAGPNPSAGRDPAKSSDARADAYRSAAGRLRRIATLPSRRPGYQESDLAQPSTSRIWWDSLFRESGKRKEYPRDLLELLP